MQTNANDIELSKYIFDKVITRAALAKSKSKFPKRSFHNGVRGVVDFSTTLSHLMVFQQWNNRLSEARVRNHWTSIIGENIAEHAKIQGFDSNAIILEVTNPTWASTINLSRLQIIKKINDAVGADFIRELRIVGTSTVGAKNLTGRSRGARFRRGAELNRRPKS